MRLYLMNSCQEHEVGQHSLRASLLFQLPGIGGGGGFGLGTDGGSFGGIRRYCVLKAI